MSSVPRLAVSVLFKVNDKWQVAERCQSSEDSIATLHDGDQA